MDIISLLVNIGKKGKCGAESSAPKGSKWWLVRTLFCSCFGHPWKCPSGGSEFAAALPQDSSYPGCAGVPRTLLRESALKLGRAWVIDRDWSLWILLLLGPPCSFPDSCNPNKVKGSLRSTKESFLWSVLSTLSVASEFSYLPGTTTQSHDTQTIMFS